MPKYPLAAVCAQNFHHMRLFRCSILQPYLVSRQLQKSSSHIALDRIHLHRRRNHLLRPQPKRIILIRWCQRLDVSSNQLSTPLAERYLGVAPPSKSYHVFSTPSAKTRFSHFLTVPDVALSILYAYIYTEYVASVVIRICVFTNLYSSGRMMILEMGFWEEIRERFCLLICHTKVTRMSHLCDGLSFSEQ